MERCFCTRRHSNAGYHKLIILEDRGVKKRCTFKLVGLTGETVDQTTRKELETQKEGFNTADCDLCQHRLRCLLDYGAECTFRKIKEIT